MRILLMIMTTALISGVCADEKQKPNLEVVPIQIQETRVKRLTDRPELKSFYYSNGSSVFVSNPIRRRASSGKALDVYSTVSLDIAIIGKLKLPMLKKIWAKSLKTADDKSIVFSASEMYHLKENIYKINLRSWIIPGTIKKFGQINGEALIEEGKTEEVEIKDILSKLGKIIENPELKKLGLKVKVEEKGKELQITISSFSMLPCNINCFFTETTKGKHANFRTTIIGVSQPGAFAEGRTFISHRGYTKVVSEATSDGKKETILHSAEIVTGKNALTKNSSLNLQVRVPLREISVPFRFKDIQLP